jgi:glycyl-tRNA synthetase
MDEKMKKIISLAKRRGFVFQSSEIYGGVESLWDFGPLGAAMKENIKKEWMKRFVQEMPNVVAIQGSIIMHPDVWKASGHLENFSDPLIDCKECNSRYRADHMEEGQFVDQGKAKEVGQCPKCGSKEFTEAKNFNLMFKTFLGPVEDEANAAYLRPETAQSMFTNFKLVQESMRQKIPFGIAQIGKNFRNEITTGNFFFRSREFDIAEIEFFCKPPASPSQGGGEDEKWFEFWLDEWEKFYLDLGLKKENLRRYEHPKEKLSHYSKRTVDIEYKFPFGWGELAGVANRTDFDLKQHAKASGKELVYQDDETKEKYVPYVIEPTMGIERAMLALLLDAYEEVEGARTTTTEAAKEAEVVLKLAKNVAPVQVAVFPLMKNKPELVAKAREVYETLQKNFVCQYDETGAIGRRYRRQDEIGTPYCVTIDFDSLENNTVTLRDRDTMEQIRIKISDLTQEFKTRFG